ncbi:serine hydrolase domain-containing protein [Streptomyces sp. NPDC048644]|uniref:serine hydrolase domain-containing protein n=1 Tax=Streptomyces sp. NPDC048644 TaxID=3365582 RepID=UPI00371A145B
MTTRRPRSTSGGPARPALRPPGSRRTGRLLRAAALALALAACTAPPVRTPIGPAPLHRPPATTVRALHRLVAAGAPGAASLITRDADLHASRFSTAGVADLRSGRRMGRYDRFRAGSLTKTLVATVVLQLAAEGRLALDDTAARRLAQGPQRTGPGVPRSALTPLARVTIRQLLDHTSGLFNYTDDAALARRLHGTGFGAHRYDTYTPAALLRIALSHPPTAPLGARYSYSNTNYLVLGMIIEAVTGRSYAEEIRRRLLVPVQLRRTSFPGTDPALPQPHGRAYSEAGHHRVDATALDPSRAGAAGEMVTTLDDLNRFFAALLGGKLLPPREMAELRDERTTGGAYGLGLYATRLRCGVTVWGHNGNINGSYAQTAGSADGRHLVSYRLNTDDLTDPARGTAVLTAEFCPRTKGTARATAAAGDGRPGS